MRDLYLIRCLCVFSVWLFSLGVAFGQQIDTTAYHELSGVEVVEKVRPSVTREGTLLQIMDRAGIDRLGVQDLSEAVKRFSGVTVQDYGGIGGLKTVSVRSLGAKHTAVSYDGVTITDAQSGQVDISRFSLDNVEMVSLSIGQSDDIFQTARVYASAGALNIQTAMPNFKKKPFNLRGQVRTGSFGLINPSVRYEQKLSGSIAAIADIDWMRADGMYPYTLVNGDIVSREKRRNSDIKTLHMELNLLGDWKEKGKMRLKGYWFDSERGLPGSVILYNDYHKERLENKNGFLQASYENRFSDRLSFKAHGKFDYAWTRYKDFHSKYIDGKQVDVYTQREFYGTVALLYQPSRTISVSLAEDVFANTLDATTPKCPFPTRYTSLTALAAQYKDERLTVTASLLGTYLTEKLEIGEAAADRKRLSPALSASWRILKDYNLRLRASFKDAFRVPTFNDLYYDRIGNKELKSEKATQYNLGLTWSGTCQSLHLGYVSLTADAYYNKVSDKIVAIPTMFIWKMMNMGKVEIMGVDVNLASSFTLPKDCSVRLEAAYTYQHSVDITDKDSKVYKHQLPYTPRHSGNISISFENPWANLSWILTAVSDRYSLPQNIDLNLMNGYVEQQLSINKTFAIQDCSLRLQVDLVNLGNVNYDVIRYYPMPGRSFRASVRFIY